MLAGMTDVLRAKHERMETTYEIMESDEDMASTRAWNMDPIQVPISPVTRARPKRFKHALNGLIQINWAELNSWRYKIDIIHGPQG